MSLNSETRLQEILNSISQSVEAGGDPKESETLVLDLINFLNSISEASLSDPDNEDAKSNAFEVLSQVYNYVCSPSLDEATVDLLSFELPKAASRFGGVSEKCLEIADKVIDRFVSVCNPRDMLSILCDALASSGEMIKVPSYFVPLLSGIAKVLVSIRRRHFEQVKVAVRIVLNVLKVVSSEPDDENTELKDLFKGALSIATSIHAVCTKLDGGVNKKLRSLLALYVLQVMALVSFRKCYKVSNSHPSVTQLSSFFPYCGLSYLGLITGSDVDSMTSIVVGEDEDDFMSCLSHVKLGASLSVIWGHIYDAAVVAAKEDLISVKDELKNNRTKRWQAIGMLKDVLASVNLPWQLKKHTIEFLLCIIDGNILQKYDDEHADWSSYMPSIFVALQAVQKVIMYASDAELRKNAFEAFKRILADIPASERFDILKALITNSDSSSMTAILLDILKRELHMENCQRTGVGRNNEITNRENKSCQDTHFWTASIIELVEFVLRPSKGGPPTLPEHGDAVLAALNLYRFVLITESTGKTNYTEALSKSNLQKAYNEWLLPLRTLVTGIMAENTSDYDQFAVDTVCTLNPVELVLYRCIELVEEKLKHSA